MPTRFYPAWDHIVTPEYYIGIPVAYLVVIHVLNDFVNAYKYNFDGMLMKQSMRLYNLVQVILCAYMIYLFYPPYGFPDVFGLEKTYIQRTELGLLVHYFSKILDFCDTIFMILRRKHHQLSFLHVFHHATIMIPWGIMLNLGWGGFATVGFGAMCNSFIHVLMYSHYFITSFGIRNPLKKYLTMAQLTQFAICLTHSFVVSYASYTGSIDFPIKLAMIQTGYQTSMLYLFGKFYAKTYSKKKPSKSAPPKKVQ